MFLLPTLTLRSVLLWVALLGPFTGQGFEQDTRNASTLIFYANQDSIRYIDIKNISIHGELVSGLQQVKALDLLVSKGWIFWSEHVGTGVPNTISRMRLTAGATKETILTNLGEVNDIAIEWETELIYWTDYMHETVEVARIDGSDRKTLVWQDMANPYAIAVDSRNGYMFWSEQGWDFPRIERATLAGTERTVIMHGSFTSQRLINGLVIDFNPNLLYWAEANTDVIEHITFNGSQRTVLKSFTGINVYPYSITIYEDVLYASDFRSRSIERINLTTSEHIRNMGWLSAKRTYGIVLDDSSRQPPGKTDCKTNSDCSHLCLLTPSGFQCACPNGYELLADNITCNATGQPPTPPVQEIEIRLMIGSSQSDVEGRVEVRLKEGGDWGTVCDDHFDIRDAKVACRMLGYDGANSVVWAFGSYGSGPDDRDIWLDNLKCRGDENSLMECKHRGWGSTNCQYWEAVGVVCKNESIPTVAPNVTSPTVGPPANFTISLRGGLTENQGRVEIEYNGKVGTICDNDFDINDAHVVCRMLGFEGAWSTMCCGWYGWGSGEIWLDSLQCRGNETTLSECAHNGWGNHDDVCTHGNDVGVYCIPKPILHPDVKIRLAEGTSENEGRVEIYHIDRWGTICDDKWDLKDANVICRMLNYTGALAAPLFSAYDSGSGQIWLDSVECLGNESTIYECPHEGWGNHDCSHYEDAGVICQTNDSVLPVYDAKKSLVFAEYWRGVLYQVNLEEDSSHHRAAPLPIDQLRGPTAVGFDPVHKFLYYAEYFPGIIRRSRLNGSEAETVVNGVYYPNRLAIDYITGNIYFADSSRDRIDVATLEGQHRSMLISTPFPEDIALDLKHGHIYWSSNGYPPRIERADMDGNNEKVILELTYDSYPSGMAVDYNQNRLYLADRYAQEVYYIDLETGLRGTFISSELVEPLEVTIHGNKLYVADLGSGEAWDGGIYSAVLAGSGNISNVHANVSKVIDLLKYPWGMDSYDEDGTLYPERHGCQLPDKQCSHLCLNAPNVPHCACPSDMKLKNATTCVYRPLILHTECYFNEIYKSPLGGDDLFSVANTLPLEHTSCPSAIASHVGQGKIFWTDLTLEHIACADLDGSNEQIIVENVYSLALVVDSYAENIFFTDKVKKTVEVAKLDGSFRSVLVQSQTDEFVGLAIDPKRGYMYYSAWGDTPKIYRAQLDGSDIIVLVEFQWQRPTALAIDVDENVLYWVGDYDASLQYMDLRYPHSEIVYHIEFSSSLFYPLGLTLDAYYFYWTDWLFGSVVRASRGPNPEVVDLIPYQYTPRGVNIYNPDDVQDAHPCVDSCSHLCLIKPGGYKCACSANDSNIPCNETTHISNAFGCTEDPSLYFIDYHYIKCIELQSSDQSYVRVKTVKDDLAQGGAIDVDHRERMIYWSDIALWTINRMSLVTGESEVIIRDDLGEIYGLAVEWESEKIYFTDFIFERIEVANIDGSFRKTLITEDLFSPRGIAVDPKSGYMFWTDYGFDNPRIERADLTGENRRSVVSFGYDWYYAFFPMSVVVDYNHDPERIFWIDHYDNYIDYADLEGDNKKFLRYFEENIRPADLALYGDILYWADWNSHSIQWFNTTQTTGMHYNFGHLTDDYLAGVVVYDQSRQPIASFDNRPPCRINNGGCSHLCLLAPGGGSKCACPNGVELLPGNQTCSNVTQPKPPPQPVPDLKVRLRGSNSSHEGRVEVYHQGKWGTICDDHWGFREASVICKMLNFSGAYRAGYFGAGNKSFPIWMDNVKCRGDEQSIAACRHRGWDNHDCEHYEDAGVVCRNDSVPPTEGPTLAPGPHPELKVRLRSGTTSNQGRVELYLNGTWGTICDDSWGIKEADVICRMLNYTEGAWSTHCCGWYDQYFGPKQIWLDEVHCVGDETSIAECRHGGWGSHDCSHAEDVGVVCKYTPLPPPGQKLRLADGIREGEGRVEIFHDGHWGTVCDDYWDIKDAQVVCNQLGYLRALGAPRYATFGEGNGHIWLSNVHCVGNESSIEDCEHAGWNANLYCDHWEDASVICSNETGMIDADDFLLFCEGGRTLCYGIPLPHSSPAQVIPLNIALKYRAEGISYDPQKKQIYWADYSGDIYRAFLSNGSQEVVVRGISDPMGIEVDVIGRNIYLADYYGNNIKVASLDGSNQAVLVDVQYPQGIALDSVAGYMYYSSVEAGLQVYRADMDGNNQMMLANLSFVQDDTVIDLVLDKPNNRLFFSDQTSEVIRYINLTSLEVVTVLSGNLHKPSSLMRLNDTLYWTGSGDGTFSGAVFKADVSSNSATAQAVADGFGQPKGIYAHNSLAYQPPAQSACQNNGGCAQLCVLKPNGRTCLCKAGLKVAEDGISCTVGDVLFVTDIDHEKIYFTGLTESILNPLPFSNVERPEGVAFDPFEDRVYWSDTKHGIVARGSIDGSNEEIIRSNVLEPTGIEWDLSAGNVYWINSGNGTIEMSKLNGDYWKVLVNGLPSSPVDIALDTTRGFMYWSAEGIIERAELDGSNRRTVAELGKTSYGSTVDAKGLKLDVEMNRLYFVSYYLYSLLYIDLNYRPYTVQTLIQDFWAFYGPYGLALDDQYVYWTEYIVFGVVFRASKTGADIDVALQGTYEPKGIAVKKGNFTQKDVHPCVNICSHLCIIKPGGYKCACPEDPDVSCNESTHVSNVFGCTEDPSLYFIDSRYIKCIELKSPNQSYVSVKIVKSDLVQAGAIDVDHRGRMIYWSDIDLWTINRMSLLTGESEVIIKDNLGEVYGLAVDWESEKVYFTDFIFERIEVANIDGTFRKTLFTTNVYSPRGIAVDPQSGYVFWTDFGYDYPRIERADLTGENRRIVVSLGYNWYYTFFPMSVVVDYNQNPKRICWIDRDDRYIDCADLDGDNKDYSQYIGQNISPVDLAFYGDQLFWADRHSHSIERFNMTQALSMYYNFGHLTDDYMAGVVVYDKSRQPIASPGNAPPCRINNGRCSHLCLSAPGGGSKCACPNGVELLPGNKTCSNVTKPSPPPPPVPDLKVRLKGSNSSHEGRVEVYHQGKWGTICDDHWGLKEASVVCKMLNFSGAYAVGYFGAGNESFPIWMDNVKCRGDEQSIAACRHRGWDNHDCEHYEDAGVVCRNDSVPPTEGPTLAPGPHPELKVRLRSGPTSNQGRVELYLNGTWGTICDNSWGIEEANVICRMAGYAEGAWSTHCCGWYDIFSAPSQIWLDDVHCAGDEQSIAECRHGGWGSHDCTHSQDVGVVCKYTPIPTPGQKVRLADGVKAGEGRVEIFHDGHWGTVCDDYWDIKDAQVVCNQLGHLRAIAAPKSALFGEGNGHIWLADVHCMGNESSIEDCQHAGWDANSYCYHFEDASVICSNETGTLDADDFLLFCESGRRLCYAIPLPLASPAQIIPLKIQIEYTPEGIFYDPMNKQMYWTDYYGNINRAFLDNGTQKVVVTGIGYPMGIEVDYVAGNIYYADNYGNSINIASLDGSRQAVLVDVEYPQGIVLDMVAGYMYYSSVGVNLKIYRADMDGKRQIILATLSSVGEDTLVDLVLDKPNNRLFFSDHKNDVIRYINLTSLEVHTVLSGNLHKPSSLTKLNDTLFWTASSDGTFSGAVFKADVSSNSATAQAVADGFGKPKGIYAHNSYRPPVRSKCEDQNGGCAQFCVRNPGPMGSSCLCKTGMKIAEDGFSCTVGDVIFVTDIDHQKIYFSGLSHYLLNTLPFSNVDSPTGVAFDPFDDRVYWTDTKHGIVARATLDGKKEDIIRSNVTEPMGIELDLVGGNAYWINSVNRTIEVSKLNGDYWKVLVSNLSSSPVDIALDTSRGYMYWSALGVIEEAEMDGSNRGLVADLGENYYGEPIDAKGLALDVKMNRLYFVSFIEYSILYIDLDSQNRSVQTLNQHYWAFYGPFGIAVDDQYVYWSEYLYFGYVFRTNKTEPEAGIDVVLYGTYDPRGIEVKKGNYTRDNDHPCRNNNGACTHLCLITSSGYTCGCPAVTDDGKPCSTKPITTPPPSTTKKPKTSKPTPTPNYCSPDPCQNGASCQRLGNGYKCHCVGYFGGVNCAVDISGEVVVIVITLEEFKKEDFVIIIVAILNEECRSNPGACSNFLSSESIVKRREVSQGPFTADDIYFPTEPKQVDGGIAVEFAVVKTSKDGKSVAVPSKFVADVAESKAAEIGRKVGGTVKAVKQKQVEEPTTPQPTGKSSAGLIAGIVVAVLIVVIIVALAVWYFRIKRSASADIPYVKEDDEQQTKYRSTTAFENPGYDSTGGMGDYDDIGPVTFAPFEESMEAGGVANPTYAEIGMTRISSSQDISTDGATGDFASKTATSDEGAGELPTKVPLREEDVAKPDYVEIAIDKETPVEEEPRYETLRKEAKSDPTNVEVEMEGVPRYSTLPVRQEADQTVLVLEESNQPTKESES